MKARIIQSDTYMENEKLYALMQLMVERLTEILATPEGRQDFEAWEKTYQQKAGTEQLEEEETV